MLGEWYVGVRDAASVSEAQLFICEITSDGSVSEDDIIKGIGETLFNNGGRLMLTYQCC